MKNIASNFIFNPLENGVHFVGIINDHGRIENILYNNKTAIPDEKMEMFCMGLKLQNSIQNDFNDELGQTNYTLIERRNFKLVLLPVFGHIIVVIMDKNKDHREVVEKIKVPLHLKFDTSCTVI